MPRRVQVRTEDGKPGASGMRAAGRFFMPGMGLLIAALGLILWAALARAEGGPTRLAALASPAAMPP